MYRAVIEHPDWMPTELKTRKDLNDGSDRGRIWRIKSDETVMPQERHDHPLDKLTIPHLVQLLDHANAWHRETAVRLLLERDRDEVLDALKVNWKQNRLTRSRLTVLWLLRTLDPRLTPAVLAWSEIDNRDPRVREQVISSIGDNLDELLPDDVVQLAGEETDDRVRFRMALDLSGRSQDTAIERKALVRLLDRGVEDPWLRIAVGTMKSDPPEALVIEILEHWMTTKKIPAGGAKLIEQLSETAAAQLDSKPVRPLLEALIRISTLGIDPAGKDVAAGGIKGLGQGATRRGVSLTTIRDELNAEDQERLRKLFFDLRDTATATMTPLPKRLDAIRTLPYGDCEDVVSPLLELALQGSDLQIRLASLEVLGSLTDPRIAPKVMEAFPGQTPQLRRAVLDVMLATETRIGLLLDSLEQGTIKLTEIDPTRQIRLTKNRNKDISSRAEKLFASAVAPDRAAVLEKYQSAITNMGDARRGRAVFEKNCVTCHRVDNTGTNVGPDIGDTRDKLPSYLLLNILDPNRAVDANFFSYTLITKQGKTFTGLVKSETATSITMRMPEGKEETILRADVDEFSTTGQSLMPVGFEKNITVEQMSDLISFLKNWRYLDGTIPLSK